MGILCEHAARFENIESAWQTSEQHVGHIGTSFLNMCWEHFGNILDNILNVIWWIHAGNMLRLHSRCTPDVIGGYIGGKMIQSLQCTQDVPAGF